MIVRLRDIRLAYEDSGTGIPIVLIHGFPHNRHLWDAQRRALSNGNAPAQPTPLAQESQATSSTTSTSSTTTPSGAADHTRQHPHASNTHYRVITPDLRGFGESESREPYSMAQYADDIAEFLSALGIKKAIIGGLSMGGYVVFELWRRYRHMIEAIILADTRAAADTAEGREKRDALIALAQTRGAAAVADNQMTGMIGATTRESRPDIVEQMRGMLYAAPVSGIVGALTAMKARPDSTADLATIDVPTLIIVGEEDVITPVKDAKTLHANIAGSTLAVIPNAGHASCFERSDECNSVIFDFLAGLSR